MFIEQMLYSYSGAPALLVTLAGLIILWIIVSVPVYFASKVVTSGKSTFGEAMIATVAGPIVFVVVRFLVVFFLAALIGAPVFAVAWFLAFLTWIAVYRDVFNTGWLGAVGIAILAALVYLALSIIVFSFFSVNLPGGNFLPFRFDVGLAW
jgi:hypothetical protein